MTAVTTRQCDTISNMADNEKSIDQELDTLLKTRVIEAKIEELRKTIATLEARITELDDEKPF